MFPMIFLFKIELLISENKIKCINHEPEWNTEISKVSEAVTSLKDRK